MVFRRVFAAPPGLEVVIVRLFAAFLDEIARQLKVTLFAGGVVELEQGQLDLFVPGIAVFLVRCRAEHTGDVVSVAHHHV